MSIFRFDTNLTSKENWAAWCKFNAGQFDNEIIKFQEPDGGAIIEISVDEANVKMMWYCAG